MKLAIETIGVAAVPRPGWSVRRLLHSMNPKIPMLAGLILMGCYVIESVSDSANPIAPRPGLAAAQGLVPAHDAAGLERLAKTDQIAFLQYCLDNYRGKYADYTSVFTKQERINGVLGKEQKTSVRFREAPFSVAMTWLTNPPMGDRILYVEGRNNNEMRVRPTSAFLQALLPGGVSRKPQCDDAKKASLRTVDLFGFERLLKSLLDVYQEGKRNGDLREAFGGHYTLDDQDTLRLVRYLTSRDKDYPAYKTVTYVDVKHLVPVMIEGYDWETDDFLFRYTYSDVKFNVGLTEADFSLESIGLKKD